MFELKDLSLSFFAIVKADEAHTKGKPFVAYGFVHVLDCDLDVAIESEISDELRESGELDDLVLEAIHLTKEYVEEEFDD